MTFKQFFSDLNVSIDELIEQNTICVIKFKKSLILLNISFKKISVKIQHKSRFRVNIFLKINSLFFAPVFFFVIL